MSVREAEQQHILARPGNGSEEEEEGGGSERRKEGKTRGRIAVETRHSLLHHCEHEYELHNDMIKQAVRRSLD